MIGSSALVYRYLDNMKSNFIFINFVFLSVLFFSNPLLAEEGAGWAQLLAKIRHHYPGVQQVPASELSDWMNDDEREPPLLLDVRSKEEYNVSHLKGAMHVMPNSIPDKVLSAVDKEMPVVTYCSVGYRSSAYARQLQKAGFKQVYNLEGSIFGWVNLGYPVYRDEKKVKKVHPYNQFWARYLKPIH